MLHIQHPLRGDTYCGHPASAGLAESPEDSDCPVCQDAYQNQGDVSKLAAHSVNNAASER